MRYFALFEKQGDADHVYRMTGSNKRDILARVKQPDISKFQVFDDKENMIAEGGKT